MTIDDLIKFLPALGVSTILGGLVTAIVKERFDKTKRADATALKLFEAKLRAYEAIQPALADARDAIAAHIAVRYGDNAKERLQVDAALSALGKVERQYCHLLSGAVLGAIGDFRQRHLLALAAGDDGFPTAAALLSDAIIKVYDAIRIDCRTDALDEHAKNMLVIGASPRTKQLRQLGP